MGQGRLDTTHIPCRVGGRVSRKTLVTAVAADLDARGGRTHRGGRHREPRVPARPPVVAALPSAESPVRLAGAVRLDQDDAWHNPACLIDPRGLREGYGSPELRGATGDQARRFLTVVEGAFSDSLGKVAQTGPQSTVPRGSAHHFPRTAI